MTSLLHFADVHLGMTNFGKVDAATGLNTRILEYLEGLDLIAEAAEELQPDVILFAGDAFRTRTPNPTLVEHFATRIQRMADVAPVVAVVGNHDRQRGGSGKRHSTTLFNELYATHPIVVEDEIVTLALDCCYVVTLPWLYDQDVTIDTVCGDLDEALAACTNALPIILLGHCEVEGAVYHDLYGPSFDRNLVYPLEIFSQDAFDYVALGHVHRHQALAEHVVYAGSIDYIDWGEKGDPKGFVTAEVEVGKCRWTFHNLLPRTLVEINVSYNKHMAQILRDRPVDGAIVKVNVRAKREADRGKIMDIVNDNLQGEYQLEEVNIVIESEERMRDFAGQNLAAKDVYELVKMYLEEKHPDDPDWVDKCMHAAETFLEES